MSYFAKKTNMERGHFLTNTMDKPLWKLNFEFLHFLPGPYLGFFVCGGKLGFREISDQYSYKKQPSKIRHYVRKKTFSFPGGGNCPLRPPAMYGPAYKPHFSYVENILFYPEYGKTVLFVLFSAKKS